MCNLLHGIRLLPLQNNLTQPILPHDRGVILLRSPLVDQLDPVVVLVVVVPPDGDVPREAAKDGTAKVRGAGQHLPVERALLVPRQGREGGVLLGQGEQVVFANDFDVVGLGGLGSELLDVFFVAGCGVDDGEIL